MAIDGHVVGTCSCENDPAEKGSKFLRMGEPQLNLLMACDVITGTALLSRIYSGSIPDKGSVRDLMGEVERKHKLLLVDGGFYSTENLPLFSSSESSSLIPPGRNRNACKKAAKNPALKERPAYQKGRKSTVVEYGDEVIGGNRVLTYRDLNAPLPEQTNCLRHMEQGNRLYTGAFRSAEEFHGRHGAADQHQRQ